MKQKEEIDEFDMLKMRCDEEPAGSTSVRPAEMFSNSFSAGTGYLKYIIRVFHNSTKSTFLRDFSI